MLLRIVKLLTHKLLRGSDRNLPEGVMQI